MNLGSLINETPPETRLIIRKIEKQQKKLSKCDSSISFNRHCLQEDILPKYSHIKLHDPAAKRKTFTKEFQRSLVSFQLKQKEKQREKLDLKLSQLQQNLQDSEIDPDIK